MDLTDIYRTFHPKTTEYTFFSSTHGTSSRIDHILGQKSSLGKFKKIEIVSSIFSDHNAMRLDINCRKKSVKITNTWRLNYPRDHWRNQRGNQKIPRNKIKWKHDSRKLMGCSKGSSEREVYSNTILPQEKRKISNKQLKLTSKTIRERRRRTKKPPQS